MHSLCMYVFIHTSKVSLIIIHCTTPMIVYVHVCVCVVFAYATYYMYNIASCVGFGTFNG